MTGRHHQPDEDRPSHLGDHMEQGTVFWNRHRWWRIDNGLHQLIVPRWHDNIMGTLGHGDLANRIAAWMECRCYICRDLLDNQDMSKFWTPPGPSRPLVATCDGTCGKTFPWYDLTAVSVQLLDGTYRTTSLCSDCYWRGTWRGTRPDTTTTMLSLAKELGVTLQTFLWLPGDGDTPPFANNCCRGGSNPGGHEWNCPALREWQQQRVADIYQKRGPMGERVDIVLKPEAGR